MNECLSSTEFKPDKKACPFLSVCPTVQNETDKKSCGQYYICFTIVIYNFGSLILGNFPVITKLAL